ncbi:MAG: transcriptional regulator [Bacilli bacterium]
MNEEIIKVMNETLIPMTAGEVADILKKDREEVDKAFKELKKEEKIYSPVRCKWTTKK